MTLFNDLYNRPYLTILSEAKTNDSIMKVLVPFVQVDEKNGNGRIYTRKVMEREVSRVSKDIADGRFLGSADHPKGGNTELNSVSHLVKKMWIEKDGRGWASLSILDTTAGKNLKTIIKAGGKLGVSTRGFGTFNQKTSEVKDDYKLAGLDIVSNPSYKAGVFSQADIFESIDLSEKKTSSGSSGAYSKEGIMRKNKKIIEDLKEDSQWSRVTKRLYEDEEDFDGTLEEYTILNGLKIRAVLAVEDGQFETYGMAMIKLGGDEQNIADFKKMDNTPEKPAEPKDFYEESLITGIDPEKRAENINKQRDKPAATDRRIALRLRVVLSNPGFSQEKIEEMTNKLLAGENAICESSRKERLLLEAEDLKKKQKAKKDKRFNITTEMVRQMKLGGFTAEQISLAIERKMTQLDEEEDN